MIKRSLFRSVFLIPIALALLIFSTYVWQPQPLIVPPQESGFMDNVEIVFPILLVIFCSFILPDSYEIELGLTCGYKTSKLAFVKFIPILLYSLISVFIILLFYRYIPYEGQFRPHIPIYVPDNFKMYVAVSFFVTVLFFASLFFFVRILTRNCYIPIIVCVFLEFSLSMFHNDIKEGIRDIRYCLVDPFISTYILSDEIPNAYAERYAELSLMHNAWTYNRILFFVLSLLLLGVTYLLLRREKLHKGFGE